MSNDHIVRCRTVSENNIYAIIAIDVITATTSIYDIVSLTTIDYIYTTHGINLVCTCSAIDIISGHISNNYIVSTLVIEVIEVGRNVFQPNSVICIDIKQATETTTVTKQIVYRRYSSKNFITSGACHHNI